MNKTANPSNQERLDISRIPAEFEKFYGKQSLLLESPKAGYVAFQSWRNSYVDRVRSLVARPRSASRLVGRVDPGPLFSNTRKTASASNVTGLVADRRAVATRRGQSLHRIGPPHAALSLLLSAGGNLAGLGSR